MRRKRRWLHCHKFTMTTPFATPAGFVWPPMWACPCGELRDVMPMVDWGLES